MQGARDIIVADAGPLTALALGAVLPQAVAILGSLLVPQSVLDECVADITAAGAATINALAQSAALRLIAHGDTAPLDEAFARGLGFGEAAVLSYAKAHSHTALIDERRTRRIAANMRVPVIGTGAVVLALKMQERITSVPPVMAAWRSHGYYLSEAVATEVVRRAKEAPALGVKS